MIQAPTVPLDSVPPAERKAVEHLNNALRDLSRFVEQFASALDLYDFCHEETDARSRPWLFIAGRDGALAIYHFGKAIEEGIGKSLSECQTVLDLADRTKLSSARRSLSETWSQTSKMFGTPLLMREN